MSDYEMIMCYYNLMAIIKKYPKILLLSLSMLSAYVIYHLGGLHLLHQVSVLDGYLAIFIGGVLFTFGFTAPFGDGILLEIGHTINPWIGAVIGGFGAVIADLMIFEVMKFELFHEEIHLLRSTRFIQRIHDFLHHESFPEKLRMYLLWTFAGIVIASPLPDELGVTLVSSLTTINERTFALLSLFCNTIGILIILEGARMLAG